MRKFALHMSTSLAENALVHQTPYCFGVDV